MSKLEEETGVIYINTDHQQYQAVGADEKAKQKYLIDLVVGRIAEGEYRRARNENLIDESMGVAWMESLRSFLHRNYLRTHKLD